MRAERAAPDTAPSIAKFSIPQVSGTHIVWTSVLESLLEHDIISPIESSEPRLQDVRMRNILSPQYLESAHAGFLQARPMGHICKMCAAR